MFSLNFAKFFVVLMPVFFSAAACGLFQAGENPANKPNAAPDELKSEIPFSTKEPDNFQAELVTTTDQIERRTLIAKNGINYRDDYNYGTTNQFAVLQTDKNYLVLPNKKIYAENTPAGASAAPDDWQSFLTNEWLNQKQPAKFEKLETVENIVKYKIVLDDSASSEIYIYVDEKLGMPVKEEFFSVEGDKKTIEYTVELKNIKQPADENLFAIPADFKKVSIEELRKEMNKIAE